MNIMHDLLYVALTIIFFALMLAYSYGCDMLGHDSSTDMEDL
jgi:hypothetical protein